MPRKTITHAKRCTHTEIPKSLERFADEIRELDFDVFKCGFLYFLVDRDEVVYVGQTRELTDRVTAHFRNRVPFTRVLYLRGRVGSMDAYEGALIRVLKPKYNIRRPESSGFIPDDELMELIKAAQNDRGYVNLLGI